MAVGHALPHHGLMKHTLHTLSVADSRVNLFTSLMKCNNEMDMTEDKK